MYEVTYALLMERLEISVAKPVIDSPCVFCDLDAVDQWPGFGGVPEFWRSALTSGW